jgi:microcystin-dependent protein
LPRQIGERGGSETETLTAAHLPAHNHTLRSNNATGSQSSPAEAIWADSSQPHYTTNHSLAQTMNPQMLESTGGSAPHDNMMPFATLSFIIALTGIFPPRQ